MNSLIKTTASFVQVHLFGADAPEREKKYRYEHSVRVCGIANQIARAEKGNIRVCTLAGLLHDVGKFDTADEKEHARVSGKVARPFLETLDLPQQEIDDVCYAIAYHYDGDAGYPHDKTKEAEIVSDADNIDRFTPIHMMQFGNLNEKNIDLLKSDLLARMEKLEAYRKKPPLSLPTSNRMFQKSVDDMLHLCKILFAQLERTTLDNLKL